MLKESKENLVLIGNGMAGVRTLEELLALDAERYQITVFGDEPYGNYNRIMLSPVLASEKTIEQIMLNDDQWYADHGITLHKGKKVNAINRARRMVQAEDGTQAQYDRLIIAIGSQPFLLPLPGVDKKGVIGFRDIHNVHTMLDMARTHKKAVVIGGGLLGLEAANGLLKQGMDVTVVHLLDTLMERQLDKSAATLLQKSLEDRGIRFLLGYNTSEILGAEHVTGVGFKNGNRIDADLVVMAVGIKPNIELAKTSGLYCERGIVVNDTLQTITDPRIYAVGECVQHRGVAYGLVAPLFEQAKVAANHLARHGIARYLGTTTSTRLKVTGIELFSAGDFIGKEQAEEIVLKDAGAGAYKKLVLQDNRITGVVLYGDTVDASWYFDLMKDNTDVSAFRKTLLFGQAHLGDSGHHAETRVTQLPDSAEICGCNGVCKGYIVKSIAEKKLFTLEDVRTHTKASASCGSCTGLVESLLAYTLGGDYSQTPAKKPLCQCTDYTHDEIRTGILRNQLKTMPAVRHYFEWKTEDGCPGCRTALNYYLLCAYPDEYQDDAQSRFINERAHGNIQKDGSYSVVPRLFGGLCTPQQLRAIADVAEKYQVPEMKMTGGQRIDLFGVAKEQLPALWRDLSAAGFVSGHAYGKAMRTVKTCVGSRWCRFGTQDSTGLGVQLEKLTWGSWMPHKFKLAVSGCPRNCAEATIKDFGVVCIDSGYELHIGGNGGIKVRVTDFLCKVNSETAVIEYCGAFCQLYREEAHYLERTAPWVERVGLASIKAAIVDDATQRQTLYDRFLLSQRLAQIDPWQARANGEHALEFTPIELNP